MWTAVTSALDPETITRVVDEQGKPVVLDGFAISGSERAQKNTRDLIATLELRPIMLEALREAERQIVYLHEKFQATGSGEAALAKIRSAIARAEA